jgi:hypothetical protein
MSDKNIRRGHAKLLVHVLNPHSKDCRPGPVGGRWKVDCDRVHELIPFHRRSYRGDHRGESWKFLLLRCNSMPGCPASALVRLEDIEFAAENILD